MYTVGYAQRIRGEDESAWVLISPQMPEDSQPAMPEAFRWSRIGRRLNNISALAAFDNGSPDCHYHTRLPSHHFCHGVARRGCPLRFSDRTGSQVPEPYG